MRGAWRGVIVAALAGAALAQMAHRPAMSYEEENPPILATLEVKRIRGEAVDRIGTVIPHVVMGLYTSSAPHKLLALGMSGDNGTFDFGKAIEAGIYRLVVKYPGLCTANVPIEVSRRGSGKRIELHMLYPGMGGCSYATLH